MPDCTGTHRSGRDHSNSGGRYFEDFEIGDVYSHWPGRTVHQHDNSWFTLLTMNTHPLHFDEVYASRTEFQRPLIVSTLTLAIIVGMSVRDVSQRAIANLGWKEIRLPRPVFAGDTLYAQSEVIAVRKSESRSDAGVVSVWTTGTNQDNATVCEFERTILVPTLPLTTNKQLVECPSENKP